jgi:hypothetical protein
VWFTHTLVWEHVSNTPPTQHARVAAAWTEGAEREVECGYDAHVRNMEQSNNRQLRDRHVSSRVARGGLGVSVFPDLCAGSAPTKGVCACARVAMQARLVSASGRRQGPHVLIMINNEGDGLVVSPNA